MLIVCSTLLAPQYVYSINIGLGELLNCEKPVIDLHEIKPLMSLYNFVICNDVSVAVVYLLQGISLISLRDARDVVSMD